MNCAAVKVATALSVAASVALFSVTLAGGQFNQATATSQRSPLESGSLPLVAVGSAVGWNLITDLRIVVPAQAERQLVGVDVFSPEVNGSDYAKRQQRGAYFGDEIYRGDLKTNFKLQNPDGATLFERTYGRSNQHSFEGLYSGFLGAGSYPLQATTFGDGKNAFAVRASKPVRVEASRFSVNARGQAGVEQLVAFLDIPASAVGQPLSLGNYDADGSNELKLLVVTANGQRISLRSSPDTAWRDDVLKVTPAMVGVSKLMAVIQPSSKQFSNSVAFRFALSDKPFFGRIPGFGAPAGAKLEAIQGEVVDPQGRMIEDARFTVEGIQTRRVALVLPPSYVPISAALVSGSGTVDSPTQITVSSLTGRVRFVARRLEGIVNIRVVALICGERVSVPNAAIQVTPPQQSQSVIGRFTIPVNAPSGAGISFNNGVSAVTLPVIQPTRLTLAPGRYGFNAPALPGSSLKPVTVEVIDGQTTDIDLEYVVQTKLEVTPGDATIDFGATADFTARVSTDFPQPVPASLSIGDATTTGNIGASAVLTAPIRVTGSLAGPQRVTAHSCDASVTRTVTVRTAPKLELRKTVSPIAAKPGESVTYTITASNSGGTGIAGVRLSDALPAGLTGQGLSEMLELPSGASKVYTIRALVTQTTPTTITNTATLEAGALRVTAGAALEVTPDPARLELSMVASAATLRDGEPVTFTITARNSGGSPISDAKLIATLPAGLEGSALFDTLSLEAGSSRVYTMTATARSALTQLALASATLSGAGQTVNASAAVQIVVPAKLEITKVAAQTVVQVGQTVQFTITVRNVGGALASNVKLVDTLPAEIVGNGLFETLDLAPGAVVTFKVSGVARAAQNVTVTNTASVTSAAGSLSASASVTIQLPARLEITKTASQQIVKPGDALVYTITARNSGGSSIADGLLEDALPATLVGASLRQTLSLAAGETKTFTVSTRVADDATGQIDNTASLSAGTQRVTSTARVTVQRGTLNVAAVYGACGQRLPLAGAAFTVEGAASATGTAPQSLSLEPGAYTVKLGATLGTGSPAQRVTVRSGEVSAVTLEALITPVVTTNPTALNLQLGAPQSFTVRVTSPSALAVPMTLTLQAPSGVKLSQTVFEGLVSSGAALTATVTATATQAVPAGAIRATLSGCPDTTVIALTATRPALPAQQRESSVALGSELQHQPSAGFIVLAQRLPSGATYQRGSSQRVSSPIPDNAALPTALQPLSDPLQSADWLYWVLPVTRSTNQYGVVYRVMHSTDLRLEPTSRATLALLPGERGRARVGGVLLNAKSALGELTGAGELIVLDGDPAALEGATRAVAMARLSAADSGGQAVTVYVRLENTVRDAGLQPIAVITALDQNGQPATDQFAEISSNLEPALPDAAPALPGYQVRLQAGVARLPLTPASDVDTVRLEARISNTAGTISSSSAFNLSELPLSDTAFVPATQATTAAPQGFTLVGLGQLQASLTGQNGFSDYGFSAQGALQLFARGEIASNWTLTAAINWRANYDPVNLLTLSGTLLPPAQSGRFGLLGDASQSGSDAISSEGTFLRLQTGAIYLQYGRLEVDARSLTSSYAGNFNGFSLRFEQAALSLTGFAAPSAVASRFESFRADGTSSYRLPDAPVQPSSERVTVVTLDKDNKSVKLEERVLRRGADYGIDELSGIISLRGAVNSTDANGNPQFVNVQYATLQTAQQQQQRWRFGSKLSLELGAVTLYASGLALNPAASLYTLNGGLRFKIGNLEGALEGGYSGNIFSGGGAIGANLKYTNGGFQSNLSYLERWDGFIDPQTSATTDAQGNPAAGRKLEFDLAYQPAALGITAGLRHDQNFTTGIARTVTNLGASYDFGAFSTNLGLQARIQTTQPLELYGLLGVTVPLEPITIRITQALPLIGGVSSYGRTDLSVDMALTSNFGLRLSNTLTYAPGGVEQRAQFTVRGSFTNQQILETVSGSTSAVFGTTNIAASYETNSVSGSENRAILGIDTTVPVSDTLSLAVGAQSNLSANAGFEGSLNLAGLLSTDNLKASLRTQFSLGSLGLKSVYSAGLSAQLSGNFAVATSLEYTSLPTFTTRLDGTSVRDGGRFSVALAWRGADVVVLSNHSGRFGVYAPNGDLVEGELRGAITPSSSAMFSHTMFRFGGAYRVSSGNFTYQLQLGSTFFFTDALGAGITATLNAQPTTGTFAVNTGLELSYRFAPGAILNAGFNLYGFNNSISFNTNPSFYIRLDWFITDALFGGR